MLNLNEIQSLLLYLTCFLSSIFLAIIYDKYFKKNKGSFNNPILSNFFLIIIIAIPILIGAIRFDVGTDYFGYVFLFEIYKNMNIIELLGETEPLFKILYIFVEIVFKDVWGLFFITMFLTLFFVIKSVEYYKGILSIAGALFIFYLKYYGYTLNIIRQMLSVAIILFSYKYLLNKNTFKYILMVIISSLVHSTALVVLLLYLFINSKASYFKLSKVILYFIILFTPVFVYLGIIILEKVNLIRYFEIYSIDFSAGGIGFLIWILPVMIPLFVFKKRVINLNPKYDLLFTIYLLQIPFSYLGYILEYASRIGFYFSIVEIILVPLLIQSTSNKFERNFLRVYFIIWYIFVFMYNYYITGGAEIFPFKSI